VASGEAAASPGRPAVAGDPFAPIATRALVAHLAGQLDHQTLEGLDRIHQLAVGGRVVTPWSSMIVLVDDAQRRALARASEADDRFEREAESGVEDTTTPGAPLELAATPEPEEWLLLCMVLLALVVRLRALRLPTRLTPA
ncbi:MAG: hypothetical protein KC501_04340, partial [Myxococcales bacterium]|nr:hypothetical protein [Myxococcales bacterium]